jgi:hypothetical protein
MKPIILVISAITLITLFAPQASGWKGAHRVYDPETKGYNCADCTFHRKNAKGQKQYRYKRTGRPKNKE